MELERAHLTQPEQRRQVVGQQILLLFVLGPGVHLHALHELRPLLAPVLLEEPLAADALGHPDHRERPVPEMRQQVG